jgi:hypothetical protein
MLGTVTIEAAAAGERDHRPTVTSRRRRKALKHSARVLPGPGGGTGRARALGVASSHIF